MQQKIIESVEFIFSNVSLLAVSSVHSGIVASLPYALGNTTVSV